MLIELKQASTGPPLIGDGEVELDRDLVPGNVHASTGPPLIGDGETIIGHHTAGGMYASTGPPLIGDGEAILAPRGWGLGWLQRVRR